MLNFALPAERFGISLLLAVTCCSLWLLSKKLILRPARPKEVATSEHGAAYTLSLVLVMPLYVTLVCLAVELALMLNVQIGIDYAAFAAARSAAVWVPAEQTDVGSTQNHLRKIRLAAVNAVTPYASGKDRNLNSGGPSESDYLLAMRHLTGETTNQRLSLLQNKYRYALRATVVECSPSPEQVQSTTDEDVTVTVKYQMPLTTPVIGALLGKRSPLGGYVKEIRSSVSLKAQFPASRNRRLGWEYDSRPSVGGKFYSGLR